MSEVFRLKGRPRSQPLPWIASSRAQVEAVCRLTGQAAAYAERYWPGPVTLVLPLLGGEGGSAVRVSSHPLARALAEALGHPVVSTSANRSGAAPARTAREVRDAFPGLAPRRLHIVDGGRTPGGQPSVIVDLMRSPPQVLRGRLEP